MKQKASDAIADYLESRGIRHVFGIVGAANAHIFDSIYKKGFTEIICVHHEQAGIMAMQTYFRTSGTVTACIITAGAGSTNGVTGVVSAWMDSIPGVIISGNENSKFTTERNDLRIWGVQGYDSTFMVSKVTKYAKRIMDAKTTIEELDHAFQVASSGRMGPCWIDVPIDVQSALIETTAEMLSPKSKAAASAESHLLSADEIQKKAEQVYGALSQSKRPLLWLGHGIRLSGALDLIDPLLKTLQTPALVSWAGIDIVDSDHPSIMGRAGVYGGRAANFILQNCDFLLTIGTRLAIPQIGYDMSELARAARIAMVDVDEKEIAKLGARVNFPVCADAGKFMKALLALAQKKPFARPAQWWDQCRKYQERYPRLGPEHDDRDGFINSYHFMAKLEEYMKPDQVVVTDMGTSLLAGHQTLKMKPGQRLMTSTGLGEMGYGLPGAIGASFARNRGEVLCLNCDGGMMMNLQELQTVAHHQLPIKLLIFNNDGYLMIKHTQKALFGGRYSSSNKKTGVSCPDFSKLAQAFGFKAFQIRTWEDMKKIMPEVQSHPGPVVCEVFTHPEQLFAPKLSLALQKDGTIVSPPLEDLYPLLPREELRENMIIGMHPKSEKLES